MRSSDNSQYRKKMTDERLSLHRHLLHEADAGHLENLECPTCRQSAVSVWFTHPDTDVYRTWYLCTKCDFHTRVQNTDKPDFFSEDRIRTDLQDRDRSILKHAIFKRPPSA
jgi:hypothetical protein